MSFWKLEVKYKEFFNDRTDTGIIEKLYKTKPQMIRVYTCDGETEDGFIYAYYEKSLEDVTRMLREVELPNLADSLTKKDRVSKTSDDEVEFWLAFC